jgi:hypothetical protein
MGFNCQKKFLSMPMMMIKKAIAQSKNKLIRYSLFPANSYTRNLRQDCVFQNGFVKHG